MNRSSYGKKCKCGHFESDHVNKNNKFYEPNEVPEMRIYFTPPPTIDNPKNIQCKGCNCMLFSPEKRNWKFWK